MWKLVRLFLLCIFYWMAIVICAEAQEKKEEPRKKRENVFLHPRKFYKKFFPNLKVKSIPVDTSYIKTYRNYLTAGTRISLPKINYDLKPLGTKAVGQNASSKFRTDVNTILGFSANYRFVSAGFAVAVRTFLDKNPGYTHSKYRTATIKYNNPKYSFEFKYIRVKGLTDINRENNLNKSELYLARPDITTKEYRFEGIYNFSWKKYSLLAPIDFTQRQVKSRAGCLLKVGFYNNQMYSKSDLLSERQKPYFEEYNNINRMTGYSIKIAPGAGANLIFKRRFYLSGSIFSPFNIYFNRLFTDTHLARKETSLQMVLDGMASLGYQSERFYGGLIYQIESKGLKQKYTSSSLVYSYVGMTIGYRFKTPAVVKKFYKKTMPPGM